MYMTHKLTTRDTTSRVFFSLSLSLRMTLATRSEPMSCDITILDSIPGASNDGGRRDTNRHEQTHYSLTNTQAFLRPRPPVHVRFTPTAYDTTRPTTPCRHTLSCAG